MKNNIIEEIWEIRVLVDQAVEELNVELFESARKRFNDIFKNGKHLTTFSTTTLDYDIDTEEELLRDREQNFAMIAYDFAMNSKRAHGENVPMKEFYFSSVLEAVWYTSWMFNNFLRNSKDASTYDVNMKIFGGIKINLEESIKVYDQLYDKTSMKERDSLIKIYNMVLKKYNEIYGLQTIETEE